MKNVVQHLRLILITFCSESVTIFRHTGFHYLLLFYHIIFVILLFAHKAALRRKATEFFPIIYSAFPEAVLGSFMIFDAAAAAATGKSANC